MCPDVKLPECFISLGNNEQECKLTARNLCTRSTQLYSLWYTHRYYASTEICTGSVLAFLGNRFSADTWSQDWGCTMSVPRQSRRMILVLARYWHKHGLPRARLRKVTWLQVAHRYWRGTGHPYYASTEICTGSVLAFLGNRLSADTWSQDWGCTMTVPRQLSGRYQLSSTGTASCLQLARYSAVYKCWHEFDFSA